MRTDLVKPLRFVGIGEVLFDVFEDGTKTLGGAPLNMALQAHQLATAVGAGEGLIISRIGTDVAGMEILKSLVGRAMSTQYLQIDPVHPTGTVSVFMRDGEPGYQIEQGAAWDFLEFDKNLEQLAETCDAVCFGSLARRSPRSRESIHLFLALANKAIRLFDVNLRRNTLTQERAYSVETIEAGCAMANMVKVNGHELLEIASMFDVHVGQAEEEHIRPELARGLMDRLSIPVLIVTRGARGTTLYTPEAAFRGNLPIVGLKDVYPVGAGDACAAGILFATALGFTHDEAVDLGNKMGTWVASQYSATPSLSEDIVSLLCRMAESFKVSRGRIA